MLTLILADGTKLENLTQNGNNYVSPTEIDEGVFEDNLTTLTIVDEDTSEEETLSNLEFVQMVHYENFHGNTGYYFVLREKSDAEIREETIDAKIDYIAMMSDIDLEV